MLEREGETNDVRPIVHGDREQGSREHIWYTGRASAALQQEGTLLPGRLQRPEPYTGEMIAW